jgi:hypothetical protein
MQIKTVIRSALAIGLVIWTSGCTYRVRDPGPGCLIYIHSLAELKGGALPVTGDTTDIAAAWRSPVGSAQVIYGTWRLYTDPFYEGFLGDYKAPQVVSRFRPDAKLGSLQCLEPAPAPPQ